MIYSLVEAEVRKALALKENYNADGSVNWNFVDSDCYMSGVNKFYKNDEAYYTAFDWACYNVGIALGIKQEAV